VTVIADLVAGSVVTRKLCDSMNMNVSRFVRYWMPVFAWMSLIFVASTDLMSGQQTSRFIGPFLRWLIADISPEGIAAVQFLVRKAAHVTEYAILALLMFRALAGGRERQPWQAWLVLGIAAAYAALDEWHQSFVASRTGSPRDVAIDVFGALLGVLIYWWFTRRSRDGAEHVAEAAA
jgi:VanZ family protein